MRRPPHRHRRSHLRHPWLLTLAIVVVAVMGGLVALQSAAPHKVLRDADRLLNEIEGIRAHVGGADVGFIAGSSTLHDVDLYDAAVAAGAHQQQPLVHVERIVTSLDKRALLHGELRAHIDIDRATLRVVSTGKTLRTIPLPEVQQKVRELVHPLRVDRVDIHDAHVVYIDVSGREPATLDIKNIDGTAASLDNRAGSKEALPASVDITGGVYDEGRLKLHADLDPFAKRPTFKLAAEAHALPLTKLNELTQEKLQLEFSGGTLALTSEIECKDGRYHGWVTPVLHHPTIAQSPQSQGQASRAPAWPQQLWHGLAQGLAHLVDSGAHKAPTDETKAPTDETKGPTDKTKEAAALATVPVRGTIDGTLATTDVDVTSAAASLLRNAFARALAPLVHGGDADKR